MTDQTRPHDDDLLTICEVAAILRTPVATLRYWRHLRIGPVSFKTGRRVFYRRGDVQTWAREQEAAAKPRVAG